MPGEDARPPGPPRRPIGKPPKVVTDEALAAELTKELQAAQAAMREADRQRKQLALRLSDLGMTVLQIGATIDLSGVAVSKWIRAAREERDGTPGAR